MEKSKLFDYITSFLNIHLINFKHYYSQKINQDEKESMKEELSDVCSNFDSEQFYEVQIEEI